MKSHFVSGYILKKFLSVFLIVSFFMAPLAPIFAQEATLDNSAPVSTESSSPVVLDILPSVDTLTVTSNETTIDASPQIDTTPVDTPTDVITDPKDEKPIEEVPVDEVPVEEEPEMMMSMMGGTGGFLGDTRDLPNIGFPSVDKASGGLSYSYPLTLPPGRNGLDPKLALEYSSQENDQGNLFGYGWNINIPYIKRINKTGIEKLYTDNYFYSSLSGELVLVSGTTYAPKVEDGRFLTYTFDGTYWTVKSKDGSVYKFGYNAGARQNNSGDTKTFKWMLEEERDTNNNYIKYEYYKNGGQIYPDTISYTGNASTDGIFTVVFSRASRNDAVTQDFGVFDVTTSYRISEIQANINGTWARKYTLGYSNGDNSQRSLLTNITEAGQDESSNTTTLSPVEFTYQVATTSSADFVTDSAWSTAASSTINTNPSYGTIVADLNDDGLPDVMESWRGANDVWYKGTYLNDGDGTWTQDTNLTPPIEFAGNSPLNEFGIRSVDLNADGLTDLVQSYSNGPGQSNTIQRVYINTGTSWSLDTSWQPSCFFLGWPQGDSGCRLIDINGDDLPDFVNAVGDNNGNSPITTSVYLNTGSGWSSSSGWSIPVDLRFGVMLVDYNGDGLVDILKGYKNPDANPAIYIQEAYKNNGDKTWSSDSAYTPPVYFAVQTNGSSLPVGTGIQLADINGDGMIDILRGSETTDGAYLNKGNGWHLTTNWDFGHGSVPVTSASPVRFGDFDGDGMIDRYETSGSGGATMQKNQNVKADLMSTVKNQYGGVTTVTYKGSPKYTSGGSILNPDLPFILMTVYQTSTDSGFGNSNIVNTYSYEGGDYYYNTITDRRFSGFNKISVSDGTTKTTTFYHQGNATDSSNGEYSDHSSKIGKVYRVETSDTSGNVYKKVVNKWDKYNQGTGRDFVKPVRSTVLTYDGDSDHKDIAEEYTYDNTYGNLTDKIMWGEVTGSNDGSFTDTGSDKYTESISYTANTTDYIVGLPYQDTVVDQSSNKVRESKTYYDTQSLGTVTDGNITKVERWKTGSTYVNTQKAYNTTYGIPTSSTDERGKTTTYSYDLYNLYPATVTNPLSQAVSYTYDYSLGKPKQFTDQNSFVYQTVYDGLDRVKEEKVPDLSSPYSPITKTAYTYTDTSGSIAVQKTAYLDGSNTALSYTYFDKLNRPIQTRVENESDYNVKDFLYNAAGLLQKESLPYSSSGTAITTANSTASLYHNFTYDPLQRISTQVNNVGTTSYAYDDWKTSITDPNTKLKHYYKDAYDNLIRVDETNSGSTYSTYYEWNGNKLLTKITDALSNIRSFTYNGLGRRLTAEDIHASADGTYGTWTYTYDDAGNLTQSVNPNSQTVNYTYNDINQVLTENYTGDTGTEITYTYGGCTNGTGKLCSINMLNGADTDYTYNSNGGIASEVKTISSTGYTTSYTYDRQSNILEITNPDSSKVKYNFNTAGTMETIQRKESGDASYTNVITDMDYGPHGKNTYREFLNGINTTNTFDATKLYRLTRINTINPNDTSSGSPTTTTFYANSSGDGHIEAYNSNWDTVHDNTAGSYISRTATTNEVQVRRHSGNYYIFREFLPFDTSSLPDNASISATDLSIYITDKSNVDNDGDDFVTVVQTSQASTSELDYEDFDQAGAVNNPTEGVATSDRKDITSISNGWLAFPLNSTGRSWISTTGYTKLGLREGHDVLDNTITNFDDDNDVNSIKFRSANYSGTSSDPKLDVTYTIPVATDFQDINYTYDANGNITQIVDSSDTNASKTVVYTYDDLNRMLTATATGVAGGQSTYTHTYTYNATGNITSSPFGTYDYSSSGFANPHAVTSIVNALNNNPVITLTGSDLIYLNLGDSWTEPGYSATDAEDGNLTSSVTVTGSVDTNTLGVYKLIYNVTDSSGLPAAGVARTISVRQPYNPKVKTLVVAGGGAGGAGDGYSGGGGGGAGGVIEDNAFGVTAQNYSITVGDGGRVTYAESGSNSVFSTLTAVGGGVGARSFFNGTSGGSGGGGSATNNGGTGTSGQGNSGGNGATGSYKAGGGGGGATATGSNAGASDNGANGGAGISSSITGISTTYAGGGAGGAKNSNYNGGTGGTGGGGNGSGVNGCTAGAANKGGGGGGARGGSDPCDGGKGVVIIAYKSDGTDGVSSSSTGGTITTSGGYQIHQFNSNGTFGSVLSNYNSPSNNNPVITLTGQSVLNVAVNSTWTEPGYSASDTEDGNLTSNVVVTGSVDTATPGVYNLVYSVVDSGNASAITKVRTVLVSNSVSTTNYSYDNNGNMLTQTNGLSNTWNYKNQLTQAVKGGVTSTYTYDYTGQRVKLGNGTTTTVYPSMYYSTDGTTKTKSVYIGGTQVATIETVGSTTTPYYIHTDHLNSINVVSDNTGAKVELLDYYPYGSTRISSGSYTNQKQYIGQYYDTNTSLNYLNARYYHNTNGQFISQDLMFWTLPQELLFDPQLQNSYSYASNNPIINSDPSGLISKSDFSPGNIANRINNILNSYFGKSQNQNSQIVSPIQTKQNTNVSQLTDNKMGSVDYGQYNVTSTNLRNRLDKFANDTNQNIIVTSGDRSSERNKLVGGANASRHLNGDAADIKVNGVQNEQLSYMANASGLFNTTIYYPVVDLPKALAPHVHVDLNPANNNILRIYVPYMKGDSIVNDYKPLINPLIRGKQ